MYRFVAALLIAASASLPALAQQALQLQNFAVFRVGDGATTLTGGTAPVSVVEYTIAGTQVQAINFLSGAAGTRLTSTGIITNISGGLSLSGNGALLTLNGYDLPAGNAMSGANTSASRVTGSVAIATGVATTPVTTTNQSALYTTGAATADGSRYWMASTDATASNGTFVTQPNGGAGVATVVASAPYVNPRVFNNQLYVADGFSSQILRFSGLPTAAATPTAIATYASGVANEFMLLDRSSAVAGVDTLYVAGSTGIQKFSFDGTTWTARGTLAGSSAFFGLGGRLSGTNAQFVTTTAGGGPGNSIQTFTDTAAFNATITGTLTTIVTVPSTYALQGVTFVTPVPEPSGVLAVCGVSACGIGYLRRRTSAKAV